MAMMVFCNILEREIPLARCKPIRGLRKCESCEGYVLKAGTYIGLNSGRVEKITGDRVEIVEIIGGRRTVTELKLQKSAGE